MSNNWGGARPGSGPRRIRRKISKAAAKRLSDELEWATEDVQDEILSELILHAPRDLFNVATECVRDMGGADAIAQPEEKPIII